MEPLVALIRRESKATSHDALLSLGKALPTCELPPHPSSEHAMVSDVC